MNDFAEDEYNFRYKRTKREMEKLELDALLITTENNYIYYTGHTSTYWTHHWMWGSSTTYPFLFVLPKDGDPVVIVHSAEEEAAKASTWIDDVQSWTGYPFSISCLEKIISKLDLEKGKIGCELGADTRVGIPYEEFEKLKRTFPDAEFVDASKAIWQNRMIKSTEEVCRIKKANEITISALERFYAAAKFGVTEREAATQIQRFMIDEGADHCQYFLTYQVRSGATPMFQSRPLDRAYEKGECVYLDFGASYKGYCADANRMFVAGSATQEMEDTYEVLRYTEEQMIRSVGPGVKISNVYQVSNKSLEQRGVKGTDYGRAGHGTGIAVAEPPSIGPDDPTVLQEGMTITIEPRIVNSYGYFTVEDTVLVTSTGHEVLTPGPRELHVIE